MNETKQYFIDELTKRFRELAEIDSISLSWEEGQMQIDMMCEIASTVNRLQHHHHHHHKPPKPPVEKPEPKPAAESDEELPEEVIVLIEEEIL